MFFDKYAENRIALSIKKSFFNSNDLRSIIVWDKKNIGLIEKEILHNPNLKVLDKIYISKNFYEDIYKDKIFWLDQFYNRFIDRKSPKLKTDIYCYIVVSKKPIFKSNKMFFTKDYRIVDNNIFIFKKKIRKKRRNIIHISDNFEEAKRNAFYLSRSKKGFPYQYFTKSQYQHKSMKSLVEKLNKEKNLKYVFLRGAAKKNDDIDVLCNSYYLFKRSIDGQSFKKKNLRLFSNAGDPLEDYGFKVSNFAKIKNKEICFDIRSVGDNYFCERWQKKLLVGRIKKENYFSLNKNDKLYSLIYHIVYHKGYIDNKYLKFLKINFKKEQINLDFLKDKINKYLKLNNYSYTRPSDLTIPLTFKMTKKEYLEELKYIDGQVETNNNSGANKMMYNVIRYQSLYNCCHISFLYLLIKNQIMFLKKILKNFIFKKVSRTFIGL